VSARQKLEDLFAGLGTELRRELLDEVLGDHRKELAGLVRALLPKEPDNEADQAIAWALGMAADAVERGHR
jgi:hypothetical protein